MEVETSEKKEKDYVKFTAYLVKVLFPARFRGGDFAIVKFRLDEEQEGSVTEGFVPFGDTEVIIKGTFPELDFGVSYTIRAKEVVDPKYGKQYNLVGLHVDYDFNTREDQRKFLAVALGPYQADKIMDKIPNPVEAFRNKDYKLLSSVSGIGMKTAIKLVKKYEENADNSEAYVELYDFGLTKNAIDKLVINYKSPQNLIDKIKENPYILIDEVDGYGWTRADAIALNSKIPPTSIFRLVAYAKYYLNTSALENGNTWIGLTELRNAYSKAIPEATDDDVRLALSELLKPIGLKPEIIMILQETKQTTEQRVALYKYYELEQNIAKELRRLLQGENIPYDKEQFEKNVRELEEIQGWSYTDEQINAAIKTLDNPVSVTTGPAGCVDMDTEYFNGEEWKRICDYKQGEKVLQYNRDGTASLVAPSNFIKLPETNLWHIKTKYGLDMCLSEEHNVYYITSKGNLFNKSLKEVKENHERVISGFSGKFITTFNYDGKGVDISDTDIELMIAVIADGSLSRHNTKSCRFNLKKDKKKAQLLDIFKRGNVPFKYNKSCQEGYVNIVCDIPVKTKIFPKEWYNFNKHQKKIFINNVLKWDGDNKKTFFTTIKENADFVQFVFSSMGYRATISTYDRRGTKKITTNKNYIRKSIDYVVSITPRTLITMGGHKESAGSKADFVSYKPIDGHKYCFTVDSGMWIMRRGDRICVTGNSGKTSSITLATKTLSNRTIAQTALSGRAASRMSEITGLEGYTMHRLLGMRPGLPIPEKNALNPLDEDIVILDETSMVDGFMFLNLLRAIRTGAKLIMLGDINQLESIGLCNLLNDMIKSGVIPTSMLNKIHRQAEASGIITQSIRAKDAQSLIPYSGWTGREVRGELKDLEMVVVPGSEQIQVTLISEYMRLINENRLSVDDIDIIVPMRKRGEASLEVLNHKIQELVLNTKELQGVEIKNKNMYNGGYTLYETDKIIITKNAYDTISPMGEVVPVYNGNTGRIKKIDFEEDIITVELVQQGEVYIEKNQWNIINLGYAITCHAKQGSEVPFAVVGIDSSSYALMSREWLYTALTRAKKHCVLVAQNTVLQSTVKRSSISNKQTWLLEILTGENDAILPRI